jgi:hypothetical protein
MYVMYMWYRPGPPGRGKGTHGRRHKVPWSRDTLIAADQNVVQAKWTIGEPWDSGRQFGGSALPQLPGGPAGGDGARGFPARIWKCPSWGLLWCSCVPNLRSESSDSGRMRLTESSRVPQKPDRYGMVLRTHALLVRNNAPPLLFHSSIHFS